jgi:hypothetical protein
VCSEEVGEAGVVKGRSRTVAAISDLHGFRTVLGSATLANVSDRDYDYRTRPVGGRLRALSLYGTRFRPS